MKANSNYSKIIMIVLCLSFCSGCFHWQEYGDDYSVTLDPAHPFVAFPAGAAFMLTPHPFDVAVGVSAYAAMGLVALPLSAITLPLQYPFLPRRVKSINYNNYENDSNIELDDDLEETFEESEDSSSE